MSRWYATYLTALSVRVRLKNYAFEAPRTGRDHPHHRGDVFLTANPPNHALSPPSLPDRDRPYLLLIHGYPNTLIPDPVDARQHRFELEFGDTTEPPDRAN